MAEFELAGYAVFAALHFLALIPIVTYFVRSLKRITPIQQPIRIALLFLRISAPIYAMCV